MSTVKFSEKEQFQDKKYTLKVICDVLSIHDKGKGRIYIWKMAVTDWSSILAIHF